MCLLPQYEQVAITDITKQLQDASLFNKSGILQTVWVLHGLIDKDQTVIIDGVKHKRGATCPIAQETIAGMIGVNRRATAHGYLKELIDASILRVEKASIGGKNCFRYIFTIFDLYANEQKTCTVEGDSTDENAIENEETVRSDDETCTAQGVHNQYIQEEEVPVSNVTGPSKVPAEPTESENRGDSLIEEKQETTDLIPVSEWVEEEAKEEKASLGKEKDVVPSKQIGEMLDSMTQSKGMGASPTDDSIEAIITAFNPQSPAISNWKHAQVASVLKGHLEGVLRAASIDMPPILFFKHCLREMDNRLADGKIDTRPSSLNYFLNAATGKDIVVCALDNLKSERTAEKTVQKTDDYVQGVRDRIATEREIPPAAKAELDRILGRKE